MLILWDLKEIKAKVGLQILKESDPTIYLFDHLEPFQSSLLSELRIQFFRIHNLHHTQYLCLSLSMISMLELCLMPCFHCLWFPIIFDIGVLLLVIVLILKQIDFAICFDRSNSRERFVKLTVFVNIEHSTMKTV